jgi:predicted PurR-regulated permease PerM
VVKTENPRQLILWGIGMTALAVAIGAALYVARDALVLIYIALLLALGFSPVVHAIEHQQLIPVGTKRTPRWLAILVVYSAIICVIAAIAAVVIPPLIDQGQELGRELPSMLNRGQTYLIRWGLISRRITFEEAVHSLPAGDSTAAAATTAVGTVATAIGTVAEIIFALITIVILAFYLLIEGNALFAGFARLFPHDRRAEVVSAGYEISSKVSAWMTGQLILAATIGASTSIGLYLLGVPYFYVLGLVSAVGELIPVVGPILSSIPAAAAGLAVSPRTALWVLLFFVVQQQAENHLLVPKIMQRQVGVSAVGVIVALLIGGSLFGIVGALLAIPTAAILQVLSQALLSERESA